MSKWTGLTYDVWGNAEDGYEVNNTFKARTVEGPAEPTDLQAIEIGQDAGVLTREKSAAYLLKHLDLDGDDMRVEFEDKKDSFPVGSIVREDA